MSDNGTSVLRPPFRPFALSRSRDPSWCSLVIGVTVLILWGSATSQAGPRIVLDEFRIEPISLRLGDSFTVSARATARGVKLGSFLLRTADGVKKEAVIPGFDRHSGGKYYVAEDESYFLPDNGKLDGDPCEGAFRLTLSTKGWKPGRYALAFFASCRPNAGPFVAARHDFAVVVEGDRVRIEDLGGTDTAPASPIGEFRVEPAEIRPGKPVKISLVLAAGGLDGIQITNPYYIPAEETLPGFQYDATKKKSLQVVRSLPDRNAVGFALDTKGWPAGVHHFVLNTLDASGKVSDYRDFAVKVIGPRDRLKVTVEDSWFFADGTHFGRFLNLRDGTLLCEDSLSRDGGRTWEGPTGRFGVGGEELRSGRVLGLEYRCLPIEGQEGWYAVERFLSADGGRHFVKTEARVHVQEAKAAMGHALHRGPLFMRSIVERSDGSLVALMAGWFKSDMALCPYGRGRPYSRSYVCESSDGGVTWQYLTTIGYDQIGSEGYNEGSMRRLASGELLAVIRTGSERDVNCQDNPIMWSISRDEGRTWSRPERTGVEGAYPSLAVLSDGQVVMSYGRPGAMMVFSADGGRTWTDATCVDATPYSGYTDVVKLSPGVLLVGYGVQGYLDPKTGLRESQLRLARVRYKRR